MCLSRKTGLSSPPHITTRGVITRFCSAGWIKNPNGIVGILGRRTGDTFFIIFFFFTVFVLFLWVCGSSHPPDYNSYNSFSVVPPHCGHPPCGHGVRGREGARPATSEAAGRRVGLRTSAFSLAVPAVLVLPVVTALAGRTAPPKPTWKRLPD